MNIEKIGPLPPEKGKQKISESGEPDSEAFKEMMKIGKTKEPELDEKGKRKLFKTEEEEEEPEEPTHTDIYYYKQQAEKPLSTDMEEGPSIGKSKSIPTSPEVYSEMDKKKLDPEKEKEMIYLLDKEMKKVKKEEISSLAKSVKEKKKIEEEKLSKEIYKEIKEKEKTTKETLLSEKGKAIKEAEFHPKKVKEKKVESSAEKSEKKKIALPKEEKKTEKSHDDRRTEISSPYQTLDLTTTAQAQAEIITEKIAPNLNPEIIPIIEHMVGAMIQFKNKDISETHIILNNLKFSNSRFYNAKIIFEKYAIAPDSYNIRLTGSEEAVTVFNENIEGLYKKLTEADLDFKIGQLSAEYERPLFKRKAPIGDSEGEPKSKG